MINSVFKLIGSICIDPKDPLSLAFRGPSWVKGDRKHPDCLLIVFLKEVLGQPFQVHAGNADSRAP